MKVDVMAIGTQSREGRASLPARLLRQWWSALAQVRAGRPRRLRLCESLSLGDRRFVAVIEFDQTRFLVGGTAGSLVLLSRLEDEAPVDVRQTGGCGKDEEES